MSRTGGFRKLRWVDPRRGKGRRGGLRVIYYCFPGEQQIWLMTLYDKDDASDFTAKQRQSLQHARRNERHGPEGHIQALSIGASRRREHVVGHVCPTHLP